MATFVLIHGAMHGGWCWRRVVPYLRGAGHEVYTPTLTGMGERVHLLTRDVSVITHVRDVLGVLHYEDLNQVILVGHSYAGMVMTAVAEEAASRLKHLVYLDAFAPRNGESALDLEPPGTAQSFEELARTAGDGWLLPPKKSFLDRWGVRTEVDQRWVWGKLTDFPLRCFQEPVSLPKELAGTLPRTYITCVEPANEGLASSAARARAEGWRFRSLTTGHDAMVTAPAELAALLLELV